ncbi:MULTISPECIES: hypothetical protein [unclassified Beijerinckia]|uniref:hypothetical protein n=1 Tax=unclassified Beijerinckia TaxID=2638183 RepID=UPI000896EFF4|nr:MULTISPECIES: hypothetical protein [unclassified Beijerinckia]MDH7798235.1 hypothetical protein [Beijerinckia sp. GAS462]SED13845.1 hypothetical protein SAMN05443249_4529 [Beijerinckia sp. 28-YEA-48]
MLNLNRKRLIPVMAVAALLGGLASAPASAAARHHQTDQSQNYQAMQPDEVEAPLTASPTIMRDSESGGGCYPTRIQEEVVGHGLQWVPELTCPYE